MQSTLWYHRHLTPKPHQKDSMSSLWLWYDDFALLWLILIIITVTQVGWAFKAHMNGRFNPPAKFTHKEHWQMIWVFYGYINHLSECHWGLVLNPKTEGHDSDEDLCHADASIISVLPCRSLYPREPPEGLDPPFHPSLFWFSSRDMFMLFLPFHGIYKITPLHFQLFSKQMPDSFHSFRSFDTFLVVSLVSIKLAYMQFLGNRTWVAKCPSFLVPAGFFSFLGWETKGN